ncbi:MAG: aminotransferase class IV [Phycisphaerales bacterium]
MPTLFLNGAFLDSPDQARISALDAGLQHAVGLFETMLAVRGRAEPVVLGLEHVQRLIESASILGLSHDLREAALYEALVETFRRSDLERARIRLTITAGDLNMLARASATKQFQNTPSQREGAGGGRRVSRSETDSKGSAPATPSDPTVLIVAQPATPYPARMLEEGVLVSIAETRANPLNPMESHKTLSYWWRLRELQLAAAKQAGEALVFSVSNQLVGGCVSNILLVKNGTLQTPQARTDDVPAADEPHAQAWGPSAVLPGITRQWAIHTAAGRGILTHRRPLTINDLLAADEVFLTNSSWGVLPVVRIEAHTVGTGSPGPITRQLIDDWAAETRPLV